ncbi:MAG: hypothetical protein BWY56_02513 [Acidobacteria bacterium ADurb.Bin340]|nr:MAG: hypothetical protein BWY56_02513 [Acidobacteria bacterium ADurb.Bin340]
MGLVARHGLIGLAHHQEHHLLRGQVFLGHPLHIGGGDAQDLLPVVRIEILGPAGELLAGEEPGDGLPVGELAGEGFDDAVLDDLQFLGGHGGRLHAVDDVQGQTHGIGHRAVLGLEAAAEVTAPVGALAVAGADAVGESFVGADLLHEAARETASAQNLVHHLHGVPVGIAAAQARDGELHHALGHILVHHVDAGLAGEVRGLGLGAGHGGLAGLQGAQGAVEAVQDGLLVHLAAHGHHQVGGVDQAGVEGLEVLPGDAVQACGGHAPGREVLFAVEQEGHLDLGDGGHAVVAAVQGLAGILLGQVQPFLGEGGLRQHLHEQVQTLGHVLFQGFQVDGSGGLAQGSVQFGGQELQPLIQLLRRHFEGAAHAHEIAGEVGEAFLAHGIEVGAAPHQDGDAHQGLARRIRGDVDRDAVLEGGLEVLGPGSLEGYRLVGELLRPGRNALGGQQGGGQEEGEGQAAVHHLASSLAMRSRSFWVR